MRTVLAFLLALLTVLFALENQNTMDLNLGPYEIHGSTAIILIGTFIFGIVTGVLAMSPSSYRRYKQLKSIAD
ncbi:MAG: lipopolysaccharide assembly protein LapA domain-containing protein [Rhodothermales bacterium]